MEGNQAKRRRRGRGADSDDEEREDDSSHRASGASDFQNVFFINGRHLQTVAPPLGCLPSAASLLWERWPALCALTCPTLSAVATRGAGDDLPDPSAEPFLRSLPVGTALLGDDTALPAPLRWDSGAKPTPTGRCKTHGPFRCSCVAVASACQAVQALQRECGSGGTTAARSHPRLRRGGPFLPSPWETARAPNSTLGHGDDVDASAAVVLPLVADDSTALDEVVAALREAASLAAEATIPSERAATAALATIFGRGGCVDTRFRPVGNGERRRAGVSPERSAAWLLISPPRPTATADESQQGQRTAGAIALVVHATDLPLAPSRRLLGPLLWAQADSVESVAKAVVHGLTAAQNLWSIAGGNGSDAKPKSANRLGGVGQQRGGGFPVCTQCGRPGLDVDLCRKCERFFCAVCTKECSACRSRLCEFCLIRVRRWCVGDDGTDEQVDALRCDDCLST